MITKYLIMKVLKAWFKKTGLQNLGLVGVALGFWILLPGVFFGSIGILLLGIFMGLNWQALKDLSDVDEKVVEMFEDIKDKIGATVPPPGTPDPKDDPDN